ncbi:putative endonuclease-reverse transcriptase [Operophtera brumata]|uniref:Putative endonuclease-reverse transcriptase n=1 Tax=Operophtera brumata TaxID=104452 RepID=A0A0L7L3Q5_OPEBR|nr:putative endonuclease-reverse transcriptase [Operophtera brumata]
MKKVQDEVEQRTSTLMNEQKTIKEQIVCIDKKIENIEEQLYNLNSSKKIVLFGLAEDYYETENYLYDQVSRAFQEIMNININPYIEEIKRIGKRGHNRPLAIELISKRMTKYILENAREFKNTGLSAGIFMDGNKLQERNELRKHLVLARKNGDHAIIRNDKLIINGKEFQNTDTPKESLNEETEIINVDDVTPSNKITQKPVCTPTQ